MKEYIKDKNNEDNYQKLQEIRVKELNGNYNEEKKNIIGMDKKKKKIKIIYHQQYKQIIIIIKKMQ